MEAGTVVESVYGNTRRIAEAVADGLAAGPTRVRVFDVASAPASFAGIDLLIVGGPTHAFSMTRPSTRRSAAEQGGADAGLIGLREWIAALDPGDGCAVGTFDTRVNRPRLPGSAASAAARALGRLGYRTIARPQTFWVSATKGPLVEGEIDRAQAWGAALPAQLAAERRRARS